MKQESVNSFNKGMLQDLGKTLPQEGSYIEGRNLRIIANEDADESGIVVNIEGNSFSIDFTIDANNLSPCQDAWIQGGMLYFQPGMIVNIGDFIAYNNVIYYNWQFENFPLTAGEIQGGKLIRCGQQTAPPLGGDFSYIEGYGDSSIVSPVVPTEEEIAASGSQYPVTIIGYTTIRDDLYLFGTTNESFNPGGVFTERFADPSSYGYIYKVKFDLKTNAATSELIYQHSQLNFSIQHPIEAIGRYETDTIQRLYWTDNYNTVRTLNVKAPNISSLTPDDLSINPSITFSKPKIESVSNGGNLPSGMYQYAYRLRNTIGAETRFSPLSGLVHIVKAAEGESYWEYSEDPENITEYVGNEPGELCQKAITLELTNIDTDYDFIEIAAIYRTTKEGVSNSYIFKSKRITGNTIRVTHSNNTDIVSLISLVELTAFNVNILRAKTISTKDNRLFIGNVITPIHDIEFDARAFRYKRDDGLIHAGDIAEDVSTYADPDFDPYNYNPEDYSQEELETNLNAINPYNELIDGVIDSEKHYKYQKDGRTLGGEGKYVKYEFIKKQLDGDRFVAGDPPQEPPFVEVKPTSADCSTGESYYDYKNPVTNANYKGYQRDEVYRFGLVLYDKQGNPGSVNWIGDIRFPRFKDIDYKGGADLYTFTLSQTRATNMLAAGGVPTDSYAMTGSQSGTTINFNEDGVYSAIDPNDPDEVLTSNFEMVSNVSYSQGKDVNIDRHHMYALGIKFTVDIPDDIKKLISGYSIVRVERKEFDRTVLGLGLGTWMYRFGEKRKLPETYRLGFNSHNATWGGSDPTDSRGELRNNLMTMDCPDFLLTGSYPTVGDCDWIEVVGEMNTGLSPNSYENDFIANEDDHFYRKFYSHTVFYPERVNQGGFYENFFKPQESAKFEQGGKLPGSYAGDPYYFQKGVFNRGYSTSSGGEEVNTISVGCETLFLKFPSHTNFPAADYYANPIPNYGSGVKTAFPYYEHWLLATGDAIGGDTDINMNSIYFHTSISGQNLFSGANELDATLSANDSDGGHNNWWNNFRVQEKPLMAWRRERPNQYGGNDVDARSSNVYIQASDFVPVINIGGDFYEDIDPVDVWGGDIYIHYYDHVKFKKWRSDQDSGASSVSTAFHYSMAFPVESHYNIGLREGWHFANKDHFSGDANAGPVFDNSTVRELYSAENDLLEFYPKSLEYEITGQFDNRVIYSDEKVNGDPRDSWTAYKVNNYRDVDGKYGPINKLVLFKDTLMALQDRGVVAFSVNPVAIATSEDSSSIVLGTGKVIQDHKYITTNIGTKHQWSVLATNKGLYWVDILTNSAYKMSAGQQGMLEISRVKGLKNYFETLLEDSSLPLVGYDNLKGSSKQQGDNPFYRDGIVTGYDAKNNEVLFSFLQRVQVGTQRPPEYALDKVEVICYNETTQTFTSFYDYGTPMFINTQDKLLSLNPNTQNQLFLHNNGNYGEFYGSSNDTLLKFIVNKFPMNTKVFDNFEWHTEILDAINNNIADQTWDKIKVETDYQAASTTLIVEGNVKRRERTWKMPVPRNKEDSTRLRDKYLTITLTYENEGARSNKIRAHYVKTKFRVSKR